MTATFEKLVIAIAQLIAPPFMEPKDLAPMMLVLWVVTPCGRTYIPTFFMLTGIVQQDTGRSAETKYRLITATTLPLHQGFSSSFPSTSTIVVSIFYSEHRHRMSTRTSIIYIYVKEHCTISKEQRGAREHQVENPYPRYISVEPRWNDINRGIPKNSDKKLYQCCCVHHKSHIN
jgi:hypothetical protein